MLLVSGNHVCFHCYRFWCYYDFNLLCKFEQAKACESFRWKCEHFNKLHISADNVFSSLAGLRFLWQLLPKSGKADDKHHLVHVPLKETPLSDCGGFCGDLEMQIEIEDQVCKIRLIFHILLWCLWWLIVVSNCWLAFCTSGFGIRFACGEGN